jgi:2-methylisocitrate lyase-like PEP mutase family enzyme
MTKQLAEQFQKLHQQNKLFIIPNVWDVASAVIFEKEGFESIATTSAGIAYSLGYADGEKLQFEELYHVVKLICNRVNIPVSVDFERGYSNTALGVKANAKKLLEAGAVGFNIEDGLENGNLEDIDIQLTKIEALIELKKETQIPFVINARTCAYWLNYGKIEERLDLCIERCNKYAKVGADCVFIPGAIDKNIVKELVNNINCPINTIANPLFNDINQLSELGVRRFSIGSGAVRSVYNHAIEIAKDLKHNKLDKMINHQFSYAQANNYFSL